MQLFLRNLSGETAVLDVEPHTTVGEIKQMICKMDRVEPEQQILSFCGRILHDDLQQCDACGLQSGSTLQLGLRLLGGGAYERCDPKLVALAKSYRWEVLICRKCYAKNPLRSSNCRKCSSPDLRKRKTGLSKGL